MKAEIDPKAPEARPQGFDSGLKCLLAVLLFTISVRVGLQLALSTHNTWILRISFGGVFIGLCTLAVASFIIWSRRKESTKPPRRWAVITALVWSTSQILIYLWVMIVPTNSDGTVKAQKNEMPEAISRSTFNLTLPSGWKEDVKKELYNSDYLVSFQNAASCVFEIKIGEKSAGASVQQFLQNEKNLLARQFTNPKFGRFETWGNYQGDGITVFGKAAGFLDSEANVFIFENNEHVCAVTDFGTHNDRNTFHKDFETLRRSFVLK